MATTKKAPEPVSEVEPLTVSTAKLDDFDYSHATTPDLRALVNTMTEVCKTHATEGRWAHCDEALMRQAAMRKELKKRED